MYEDYSFYDKDAEEIPTYSSKKTKQDKHNYCTTKNDCRNKYRANKKYGNKYNKAKDIKESRWN